MYSLSAFASQSVHSYDVPFFMYAAIVVVLIGYAAIEAWHSRTDHKVEFKEAVRWSAFYIAAALLFSVPIFFFINPQAGAEYLAAWAIEKALSLDNLFVIGLIFASFKVEQKYRRRMLNYGIAGAIVFRLIFILVGFELLQRFAWISIIFGLILLRAAWHTFKEAKSGHGPEKTDMTKTRMWHWMNKILPIHPKFVGHQLTTVINGKRFLTLMAAVIILIELTDIIFAVDSVPAVLAVSPDRYIAYASNVFAILGLRSLYFVYDSVASKFWALNWALAAILLWIGFKMIATPLGLHMPVVANLIVLAVLLFGGIVVSLLWKKDPQGGSA
jgi:tellurite resistance protein TerC